MKTTRKGGVLVDVLDPARTSYEVAANGDLRLTLQPQSAMILVPQAQVKD